MADPVEHERRRHERFDANLFMEMINPTLNERIGRGVVVDVSLSGLAIETETELDVGNTFDCHIEMPLVVKVKVIRRLSSGHIKRYGIQMIKQGFFTKLLLRKFLKGSRRTRKV